MCEAEQGKCDTGREKSWDSWKARRSRASGSWSTVDGSQVDLLHSKLLFRKSRDGSIDWRSVIILHRVGIIALRAETTARSQSHCAKRQTILLRVTPRLTPCNSVSGLLPLPCWRLALNPACSQRRKAPNAIAV